MQALLHVGETAWTVLPRRVENSHASKLSASVRHGCCKDTLIRELDELAELFEKTDERVQVFTKEAIEAAGMTEEYIRRVTAEMYGEEIAERVWNANEV